MKTASLLLRESYISLFQNYEYNGVSIPFFDEYVSPSIALPQIQISTYLAPKCYVLITNQTTNDASLKCYRNENLSLQLDVTTIYDANSGGFKLAELIANDILEKLFIGQQIQLTNNELNIWRGWLESSPNISEETQTSRIFRKILVLNHSIQIKNLTT
jgi:hypothetical protein